MRSARSRFLSHIVRSGLLDQARGVYKLKLLGFGLWKTVTPGRYDPPVWLGLARGGFSLSWTELGTFEEIFLNEVYGQLSDFRPGRNGVVLDVGANVGLYSAWMGLQEPSCTVYAFEPNPRILRRLRRNLLANGLAHVQVIDCAVWSHDGDVTFAPCKYTVLSRVSSDGKGLSVPAITLDTFVREKGIRHIDILKIDAEFAEDHVLLGARECALGATRRIVMEWHSEDAKRTAEEVLAQAGFTRVLERDRILYLSK